MQSFLMLSVEVLVEISLCLLEKSWCCAHSIWNNLTLIILMVINPADKGAVKYNLLIQLNED